MFISRQAPRRILAGGALAVLGLAVGAIGGPVPAIGQTDTFQGDDCTPTAAGEGVCTIDEPEGTNPDTYGTVTYQRTTTPDDDRIVFDVDLQDPDGTEAPTLREMQICIQRADGRETNPYTPARANSCAGQSADRVYVDEEAPIGEPVTIDLDEVLGNGFTLGEKIFFAVHMTIDDDGESRTVMVTGPVGAPGPATRTLLVNKDVVGGQDGERFTFTVDCGDYALSERNHDDGAVYENGDATFSLGDGGEAVFTSIPRGATCTVGEQVPAGEWATSVNGEPDGDRAVEVTLDEDRSVAFTNQAATNPAGNGGTTTTTTTTTAGDTEVGGVATEQPAAGGQPPAQGQPPAEEEGPSPTQVAGVQEERVGLPRTGTPSAVTVAVAAALLMAGTGLRLASSHRPLLETHHGSQTGSGRGRRLAGGGGRAALGRRGCGRRW
jgi:hypothetical protein